MLRRPKLSKKEAVTPKEEKDYFSIASSCLPFRVIYTTSIFSMEYPFL